MRNFLIIVAAIVLALWYFRKTPSDTPAAPSADGATAYAPSRGPGCLIAADKANQSLADAIHVLIARPVDSSKWSDAESRTSSLISSAESECSGAVTDAERAAMEDARAALGLMRATLGEGSKASLGGGGLQGVMRQEAIDNHLSAAHSKLGLR